MFDLLAAGIFIALLDEGSAHRSSLARGGGDARRRRRSALP